MGAEYLRNGIALGRILTPEEQAAIEGGIGSHCGDIASYPCEIFPCQSCTCSTNRGQTNYDQPRNCNSATEATAITSCVNAQTLLLNGKTAVSIGDVGQGSLHVDGQIFAEYDGISGDVVHVTLNTGNTISFNYGGSSFTAQNGVFATLRDTGVAPPLGPWEMTTEHGDIYVFDTPVSNIGNLKRLAYRAGRTSYFGYDAHNRVSAIDPGKGVVAYYGYPDAAAIAPNVIYEGGPLSQGRPTYYEYSGDDVTQVTHQYPTGCQTQVGFDVGGRVSKGAVRHHTRQSEAAQ